MSTLNPRDFETEGALLLAMLLEASRAGQIDRAAQLAGWLAHWVSRLLECQPCPDCGAATVPCAEEGSDYCETCPQSISKHWREEQRRLAHEASA